MVRAILIMLSHTADFVRIDPIITPEIFAQSIVDDYALAPSYHAVITKAIQDQLSDYKAHSTTFGEDGVAQPPVEEVIVTGTLDQDEAKWWESWREKAKNEDTWKMVATQGEVHSRKRRKVVKDEEVDTAAVPPAPDKDQPMAVDEFEEDESKALEEFRILIKVCLVNDVVQRSLLIVL